MHLRHKQRSGAIPESAPVMLRGSSSVHLVSTYPHVGISLPLAFKEVVDTLVSVWGSPVLAAGR